MTKEKLGNKVSVEKFTQLMTFLKDDKIRVEKQTSYLNRASSGASSGGKSVVNVVTGAVTLTTNQHNSNQSVERKKKERNWNPCLGCNIDGFTDLRPPVILWIRVVCETV